VSNKTAVKGLAALARIVAKSSISDLAKREREREGGKEEERERERIRPQRDCATATSRDYHIEISVELVCIQVEGCGSYAALTTSQRLLSSV